MASIIASWKNTPLGAAILRLMLGGTWVYGGWVKATDPGFLDKASPNYIGAQLTGYIGHSPISFLLRHMIEHAQLMGWAIMLSEFAIGIAVLAGVAMQLAIIGGASISLILWLCVTWTVKPYFLGSDTAYFVMWVALFFLVRSSHGRKKRERVIPNLRDRREVMGMVGVAAAATIAALAGGAVTKTNKKAVPGTEIVKLASFAVGQTMQFKSSDGSPAILFRTKSGVYAYSAVCTHQGCTVAYDSLGHTMRCPCHGAVFDSTSGKAISGPTQQPLGKISVAIRGDAIVAL